MTFGSSSYGIIVKYPKDRQKAEFSRGIADGTRNTLVSFLSPLEGPYETFREYLIIQSANVTSKDLTLKRVTGEQITYLKDSLPSFSLLELNRSITLANHIAYEVVYAYNDPIIGTAKAMEIWIINDGKAYILSYYADIAEYYKYLPSILKMIFETNKSS